MKRFLRQIILVVLCICIWSNASAIVFAEDETDLKLYARSAILMDAATGRVLYEENGYAVMPMASTTKIMTCILALESGKLEEYVTVSANAARQPKVRLGLKEGESYLLKDLLYSLMLESHNDTAVAIAEFVAGNVESFADMMNDKAVELGCEDTFFITPNGLDATKEGKQHSSTAYDLAIITAYALENDAFREIIATSTYSFMEKSNTKQYTVYNKDAFLKMYEGAVGVKTGFTNGAGYCFVGAVEQGEACFISVVLASGWPPNKSWKWADTKTLMNYGTQNYRYTTFCGDSEYGCIRVEEGIVNEVPLVVMREEIGLLLKEDEVIEVEYELEESLTAPVYAGQKVGCERYVLEGDVIAEFSIIAAQKAERIHFWYCFGKIVENFLI
ncbi:MAG: D-alanyl-D-alanine carboxypeptidase [Lachnospiraceae bacterium]|nr:D-alanyl-D-alanine carboxypeptidase [Lachnospiraceae bacterium]